MGWRGLRDDGEGAACVGGQHEPGRVCGQGPVLPGVAGVRWLDMQGRRAEARMASLRAAPPPPMLCSALPCPAALCCASTSTPAPLRGLWDPLVRLFTSDRRVSSNEQHVPGEEVLSDEDLFRAGLQFVLSDGRWEDLSEVGWEPRKQEKREITGQFESKNHGKSFCQHLITRWWPLLFPGITRPFRQ